METEADDPLLIPADLHAAMIAHARREAPLECCGLLGGIGRRAEAIYPLRNAEASEKLFLADSRDLIAAHVAMRDRGWDVVAVYHSHPRTPASPSRTDLERNQRGATPQVIISLRGEGLEFRAWIYEPAQARELRWKLCRRGRPASGTPGVGRASKGGPPPPRTN